MIGYDAISAPEPPSGSVICHEAHANESPISQLMRQ